jgi:uncharacterized RDD family membrane protein YckC
MLDPFLEYRLASRWARCHAAMVDNLLVLPGVAIVGYGLYQSVMPGGRLYEAMAGHRAPVDQSADLSGLGVILVLIVCLLQGLYLWSHSQTLGKMLLWIRIVRQDGQGSGVLRNVLLRSSVPFVMGCLANGIPLGCLLFAAVDTLFIVGGDRRCLHDRIAGTVVIRTAP